MKRPGWAMGRPRPETVAVGVEINGVDVEVEVSMVRVGGGFELDSIAPPLGVKLTSEQERAAVDRAADLLSRR